MNVSLIVATFGSDEWRDRGHETAECAKTSMRFHSVVTHHWRGDKTLAEARNAAAKLASGDWLCFLDADDCLEPGYLEAMELAFAKYKLPSITDVNTESGPRPTRVGPLLAPPLLAPGMRTVDEAGRPCPPFPSAQLPNRHQPMGVLNHCVIGTLVPRRLFLDVGGFGEERTLEDWAMFLRCVRAGARIVDVPDAVYVATVRPGSRNTDQAAYESIRAEHERSAT